MSDSKKPVEPDATARPTAVEPELLSENGTKIELKPHRTMYDKPPHPSDPLTIEDVTNDPKLLPKGSHRPPDKLKDLIDPKDFERLVGMGLTLSDMAAHYSCSEFSIDAYVKAMFSVSFRDYANQKRQLFRSKLRSTLWKQALGTKGDKARGIDPEKPVPSCLIFLAKNELGYSDNITQIVDTGPSAEKIESMINELKRAGVIK